jgi:flagellar capping protein FliD
MNPVTETELKNFLEQRFNQLEERLNRLDKDLAVYTAKSDEKLNSIDTQLTDLKSRVGQQTAWFVSLLFLFLSALIALAAKLAKWY